MLPDSTSSVSSPVSPSAAESPSLSSVSRIQLVGYKLGDVSLSNGIPLFSREGQRWIESRTGQKDVTFDGVRAHGLPWQNQRPVWPALFPHDNQPGREPIRLPAQGDLQCYYDTHMNSPVRRIFPVVDPVLFPAIVRKAYHNDGDLSHPNLAAKAFVFSFLAFASLFEHDKARPSVDVSECVFATQLLLSDILNARASTEGLAAIVMLVSFLLLSHTFLTCVTCSPTHRG